MGSTESLACQEAHNFFSLLDKLIFAQRTVEQQGKVVLVANMSERCPC